VLEEAEPLVLHWAHYEWICHESREPLKVEGWRPSFRSRQHEVIFRPWDLLIKFGDLDGEEVVFGVDVRVELLLALAHAKGCEGLGDCVSYATEDLMTIILVMRDGGSVGAVDGVRRW
jgi:hypothetical protein